MTSVQSPFISQVQKILEEYVSKIPTHSTIHVALKTINNLSLKENKTVSYRIPGETNDRKKDCDVIVSVHSTAGWRLDSPQTVAICALRALVTYLALQALSYVSLCINGAAGAGKIILGVIIHTIDYDKAQDFAEMGFFQILTAVYDYAVGQFGFICSIFALIEGFAPETAFDLHSKIFQPFETAIQHVPGESAEEVARAQGDSCLIQRLADTFQEMILNTNAAHYGQNLTIAFNGASPARERVRRTQSNAGLLNQS